MSIGLLALLDDVAGLAKVAAASIDDVAGQAAKAGLKAAGAVVDDTAVTPRYVAGFSAERELPIIWKITLGSLRNKAIIIVLLLLLSFFLPAIITPLLMIGGGYLCYEGAEKVYEALAPHAAHAHESHLTPAAINPENLEDEKVAGAIKTDFILSAEIMTIALATLPTESIVTQAVILIIVAIAITVGVYGVVALIVKADDVGVHLASNASGGVTRAFGRGLVLGMPIFMNVLGVVGTAAMIWVGGGILLHGLEEFGLSWPEHTVEELAEGAAHATGAIGGFVGWLVTAAIDGVIGLVIGFILIPIASFVIAPLWNAAKGLVRRPAAGH